jgi:hypothetical protein
LRRGTVAKSGVTATAATTTSPRSTEHDAPAGSVRSISAWVVPVEGGGQETGGFVAHEASATEITSAETCAIDRIRHPLDLASDGMRMPDVSH